MKETDRNERWKGDLSQQAEKQNGYLRYLILKTEMYQSTLCNLDICLNCLSDAYSAGRHNSGETFALMDVYGGMMWYEGRAN